MLTPPSSPRKLRERLPGAIHLAGAGKQIPGHVRQAFDGYLQCGREKNLQVMIDFEEFSQKYLMTCARAGRMISVYNAERVYDHECHGSTNIGGSSRFCVG
jgi:hypothetical protein